MKKNISPTQITGAILAAGLFLHAGCSPQEKKSEQNGENDTRPNMLLILADDMGFSDIGCFGSEIKTPNLDKLAEQGVRMSSFYNNARCCPSRAALLTGLYPHQAGIGGMTDTDVPIPEYQGYLNDNSVTIADVLRDAGYSTYLAGKWHVGEEKGQWPLDHGFDRCFSSIKGAGSYFDFLPYRNESWPPGNEIVVVEDDRQIEPPDTMFYATDLYTDYALKYIREHDHKKPFFLYVGYTAPHWPLHALPEDISKYKGKYLIGWDSLRQQRFRKLKDMGLIHPDTKLSDRFEAVNAWDSLSKEEKEKQAHLMTVYAAMIDRMDQNIGRLINQLEQEGYSKNTLIIFLSDNGGCSAGNLAYSKYSHPRFDPEAPAGTPESFTGYGKAWANVSNTPYRLFKAKTHEGGIASPFIAWFPQRFKKGVISDVPGHITDIMPTLAGLAKTEYPERFEGEHIKPQQGISLLPVFEGPGTDALRTFYFEHMGNCAVIEGDWKVVKLRDRNWELYNIRTDRSETKNLVDKEPDIAGKLIEKYVSWTKKNRVLPRDEVEKAIPYQF